VRSRGFLQVPYRPCFAANGFRGAGEFTPTLKPILLVHSKNPQPDAYLRRSPWGASEFK
jgi:hypothetical protein